MYKLYNGCPNDELQAKWDSESKARKDLDLATKQLTGNSNTYARITYYPVEGKYSASMWVNGTRYVELTPEFHNSIESCARAGIDYLKHLLKIVETRYECKQNIDRC